MFTVTREWVNQFKTRRGGYLAVQIHALGYSYPPPRGWLKRAIGKTISLDQKTAFELGAFNKEQARKKMREVKNYNSCLKYGWVPPKPQKTIKPKKPIKSIPELKVVGDSFLQSFEWRKVRMQALKKYGPKCMCCGATPSTGAVMNVDHIKPRKIFPSLALDVNNLQILCNECNHGKGNWDMTDWRIKNTYDDELMI